MRKTWQLALLFVAPVAPVAAFAHGSDRLKVVEQVELPASPAAVWAVVGHFHDMSWDPAITATSGDGGDALDSKRTLVLQSGGVLPDEVLDRYDAEAMSYTTFLPHNDPAVLPVTNFSTILKVRPGADGGSVVVWRAAAFRGYPNDNPPPELNDAVAFKAMQTYLRTGLEALRRRFTAPGSRQEE